MERQIRDFTKGPILGQLLRFSLPILLALFLQALYGAVDLLIVGKFAATQDVSGVAVGSQIMMTITGVVSSFAMGTTIFLGQRIGAGEKDACAKIVGSTIVMFLGIGLFLSVVTPLLAGPLAQLMNAPAEAFAQTKRYLSICGAGYVVIVAYNVLGSVMRGLGDSRTPLMTVAIASCCNIAGDLLLVAGAHLGATGAAIATVASQTVSVLISLLVLLRRGLPFPLARRDVALDRPTARSIVRFGAPVAAQEFLVSLSFLVILSFVNKLGLNASAGLGVAEKVCFMIMLIPIAFMQSMSAYVAQNYGAGQLERAVRGLRIAILVSTAFGAVMAWLAFFHGDALCAVFSDDGAVIAAGFDYLRAYGIDCLLTCFLFCFIGYFNGLGRTGFVMLQGVFAAFAVRIPIAWWMSVHTARMFYIGLSVPCSTLAEIIACFIFFAIVRKQQTAREAQP